MPFYLQGFRLGSAVVSRKVRCEEEKQSVAVNKSLLSIDYTSSLLLQLFILFADWDPSENIDISDYKQAGEIGFKKPKAGLMYTCCTIRS